MKIEKLTLALSVTAVLMAMTHEGVAATKVTTKTSATTLKTSTHSTLSGADLQRRKNIAFKKTKKPMVVAQNSRQPVKKKRLTRFEREELAIDKEMNAFELAAIETPLREEKVQPALSTTAKVKVAKSKKESPFSGDVNFIFGQDSNPDPDKTKQFKGTFFQVDPSLNFKLGNWSGGVGASIKDFSDPVNSELFKTNEAKANLALKLALSTITTSTTAFDYLYHDERWPDYINGEKDIDGNYVSMPIRYSNFKLTQTLDFKFDNLQSQIGGSAAHRDYYNGYTDYADVTFAKEETGPGELKHERDYDELSLFGKLTFNAASFLDLSASPMIKQTQYKEREGRLPNGKAGGEIADTPLYELITSQIGFDIAFKFGDSNITPTAVVGQVSDESLGAEDNSFVGVGLNSTLVIDKNSKLTLTPNVMYKKINYENWTAGVVPEGQKREETETSAGVNASVMFSKNFGMSLGYNITREKSNIEADPSENYRQEVVTSGFNFTF